VRTPFLIAIFGLVLLPPPASAQEFTEGWEFNGKAQAVLVGSTVDDVERLPASNLLGEVSVRATAEKTLQNSAKIGFRFEAKAQQDNRARAGFTGNVELFDPPAGFVQLRGAYSGLTRAGAIEDAGIIGAVETAQIFIDGGCASREPKIGPSRGEYRAYRK